jgi:hypothetical protein
MNTWWDRATDAQKLAQIDAGIALGMTGKQISMNLRAPVSADGGSKVTTFARRHGRSFHGDKSRAATTAAAKRGGRAGGKVAGLLNARRQGIPETNVRSAYDIFGSSEDRSFEMAFFDEEMSA